MKKPLFSHAKIFARYSRCARLGPILTALEDTVSVPETFLAAVLP